MRISDWSSDVCSSDLFWSSCTACPERSRPWARTVWSLTCGHLVRRGTASVRCWSICTAAHIRAGQGPGNSMRSEEHTSELQSLMRISNAVSCLIKKIIPPYNHNTRLLSHKYYPQ